MFETTNMVIIDYLYININRLITDSLERLGYNFPLEIDML
jgi:hypothetical protein